MPPAASSHPLRPNSPRFIFPALAALPLVALTACVSPERDAVSPDARTRWIAPAGEAGGGAGEAPRAAPRPAAGSASRAAFEAGEPLDLVALTDLALDNNPSTRLAWAAARVSSWLLTVACCFKGSICISSFPAVTRSPERTAI